MKILYIDCFSGISGDMFLGACVDIGVKMDYLEQEIYRLNIKGCRLEREIVKKNGITATKVKVIVENADTHKHRHLRDVKVIIESSTLGESVKTLSKKVFDRLAEAEAIIHGITPDEIHFHEVGAIDAILDIVGAAICIDNLNVDKVYCSALNVGSGFATCQHGVIPVPAPATLELLKSVPIYMFGDALELVTPTGAAIVTSISDEFGPLPSVTITDVGYGAGNKNHSIPNLLRLILCRENSNGCFPK